MTKRNDDWASTTSALGGPRDKSTGLYFQRRNRLGRAQLESLYEQNAICARVVDRLPFDAFREGWTLSEVDAAPDLDVGRVLARVQKELALDTVLSQAVQWSRLYGGALVAFGIVDGRAPSQPIDLANASMLTKPVVVAADDALPTTYDSAFGSPTYRQVLEYSLQSTAAEREILIHHSRILKFEPIELPLEARAFALASANGWGPSVLDRLFDDLGKEGAARSHAVSMLYSASILYVKLVGLRDQLKAKAGEETVRKILANMRCNLDVHGLLGLDEGDDVGSVQHQVQGIERVIDAMRDALAAATDMPKEILFNESPAGLNAGELSGPQELWFAYVSAFQKKVLTPAIERALRLAFAVWQVPIRSFQIEWNPLWVRSESATAEVANKNALTDQIYYEIGAVTAEQIRQHRFVEGRMTPIELTQDEIDGLAAEVLAAEVLATGPSVPDLPEPEDAGRIQDVAKQLNMPTATLTAAIKRIQDVAKQLNVPTATLTAAIKREELRYWGIGSQRTVSKSARGR